MRGFHQHLCAHSCASALCSVLTLTSLLGTGALSPPWATNLEPRGRCGLFQPERLEVVSTVPPGPHRPHAPPRVCPPCLPCPPPCEGGRALLPLPMAPFCLVPRAQGGAWKPDLPTQSRPSSGSSRSGVVVSTALTSSNCHSCAWHACTPQSLPRALTGCEQLIQV